MNQILEAAMLYRSMGLFVIPLSPKSKVLDYLTEDKIGYEPHSTTRPSIAEIDHWFEVEPDLNIGIRLAGSALTVVDVDDLDQWALWAALLSAAPDVPRVKTLKGMHYFFKASPEDHCGVIYHNDQYIGDFLTPTPPAWRAWDRAYVVAPPSVHPLNADFRYKWDVPLWDRKLVPVPEWIREAVIKPVEPSSWWDYAEDYEDPPEYNLDDYYEDRIEYDPDDDPEIVHIVNELLEQRYPDGLPENLDWGDLYADAYQLQAERAAVGQPCPKCGKPLPDDLLCECQTEMPEPNEDDSEMELPF